MGVAFGRSGFAGAVAVGLFKVGTLPPERAGEEVDFSVAIDVTEGGPFGVNTGLECEPDVGGFVVIAVRNDEGDEGEGEGKFQEFHLVDGDWSLDEMIRCEGEGKRLKVGLLGKRWVAKETG